MSASMTPVSYTHLDVYKRQEEYWTEHQQDFFYIVDGSFLEDYDEFNIGVQFKAAATVSITYEMCIRDSF